MRTYTVRLNVVLPSIAHEGVALSEAIYDRLVSLGTEPDLAGGPDDPYYTFWVTLVAPTPVNAVTTAADQLRAAANDIVQCSDFEIVSLEVQAADTDDRALTPA
jgi:hypothetical protein